MQSTRKAVHLGLLSGLMLAVTPTAQAQDFFPPPADFLTPVIESQRFGNILRRNIERNNSGASRGVRNNQATRSNPQQTRFAYTPTPALKQKTVQGLVNRLKSKNPAASQLVANNFGSGKYDYGQIYRSLIKDTGLRENDAADAMSVFLILGYLVTHNIQSNNAINVTTAQGVRSQVSSILASNPQLAASGVSAQLGEELKLQTVIVHGGWQAAARENSLLNYQQAIAAMFKNQYGMDMSQMRLTEKGFAKK